MSDPVVKILRTSEARALRETGKFHGSPDDLRDGFIHLSNPDQVAGSLAKHFLHEDNLALVIINPDTFGADLQWEPSRNGDLFPHLYAALRFDQVARIIEISRHADGTHIVPELKLP